MARNLLINENKLNKQCDPKERVYKLQPLRVYRVSFSAVDGVFLCYIDGAELRATRESRKG